MNSIPDINNYCQRISSFFPPVPVLPSQPLGRPDPDDSETSANPVVDSVQTSAQESESSSCSDLIPPTALTVEIEGQRRNCSALDLSIPTFFTELQGLCQQASSQALFVARDLFSWPDESRYLLLKLIKDLGEQARMQMDEDEQRYASPFEAIVAHLIGTEDFQRCSMGQRAAIEAATLFIPADAWSMAASEVCRKLKKLGVSGILPQSILKRIQTLAGTQEDKAEMADPTALAEEFLRERRQQLLDSLEISAPKGNQAEDLPPEVESQDNQAGQELDSILEDSPVLRYFQEDYYVWQGRCWQKVDSAEFETGVTRFLQTRNDLSVTKPLIGNVVANVQGLTCLRGWHRSLPFWIEAEVPLTIGTPRLINLANGMLNLDELLGNGVVQLYPHDPRHITTVELPYAYDPQARCPLWERTLAEIFPRLGAAEDDRRIEVLQEFMGWSLFAGDMQFESFLTLVGKGANGKSTLLRVWDKLLGSANVSHVPLEGLASEFRIHEMAGKLANIAGDMQRMEKVEEGILKQLISGEPIQVNRKHRVPVTMMPTAKMVFATNELPPINDRSDGIWRRMIVVPFSVQFPVDQRDTHRAENLTNELPGIVNWALAGARRLYQQGRFTICPICAACVEEHRIHSDPFQQFIAEETTRGPDVIIHTETLYKAYVRFCESNGRKPRNSSDFGKQVCGLPGVVRQRQSIGPRLYEYRGITCRSALYCGTFVTNHHAMFAAETMN